MGGGIGKGVPLLGIPGISLDFLVNLESLQGGPGADRYTCGEMK